MSLAGAGAGAADALTQILTQRRLAQQQAFQDALEQQRLGLEQQNYGSEIAARNQAAKNEDARIRASIIGPNGDVSATDLPHFTGTPYEAMLDTKQTLPSRTIPLMGGLQMADQGGQSYTTLKPTAEEQHRIDLANLVSSGNLNDPKVRSAIIADEVRSGKTPASAFIKTDNPTGSEDDQKYESIIARKAQKLPVSPQEDAFAQAYERRKTLGPEASASAAAARQADTFAQQNRIQQQSQDFTQKETGRKELSDKVETPYLDARHQADSLRTIVDAAKNGNMEASSIQSLKATLGLLNDANIKRINSVELAQVAGAGSLLDRLRGAAGRATAGQPLDPQLQADLVDLASKLEQSSRKRYEEGFRQTTKRYGLNDEQMLPNDLAAPAAPPAPASPSSFRVLGKR